MIVSGAGSILNGSLNASVSAGLCARSVKSPTTWPTVRSGNVATPLTASTGSIPRRIDPAGASVRRIDAELSVTRSPFASRTCTVTAGLIDVPYTVSVGCWTKARCVARFQVTVLSVDVEGALGLPVRPVATPAGILTITVPDVVIPVTSTE